MRVSRRRRVTGAGLAAGGPTAIVPRRPDGSPRKGLRGEAPPVYSRRCAAGCPIRVAARVVAWSSRVSPSLVAVVRAGGGRGRPSGPHPGRASPTTLDPAAQGDGGQRRRHGPALRDADHVRRRPRSSSPRSPSPGGSRTAGRGSSSTCGPDLTFSDGTPLARQRRRPQLAPDHRPGRAVAAGLADARRRRRGRLPRAVASTDPAPSA